MPLLAITVANSVFASTFPCPTSQALNKIPWQLQTVICPSGKSFCLAGFTADNGLLAIGVALVKANTQSQTIANAKGMIQNVTGSYRKNGHYAALFGGATCFYAKYNTESAYTVNNGTPPAVYYINR